MTSERKRRIFARVQHYRLTVCPCSIADRKRKRHCLPTVSMPLKMTVILPHLNELELRMVQLALFSGTLGTASKSGSYSLMLYLSMLHELTDSFHFRNTVMNSSGCSRFFGRLRYLSVDFNFHLLFKVYCFITASATPKNKDSLF